MKTSIDYLAANETAAYTAFLKRGRDNLLYAAPEFLAFLRAATGSHVEVLTARSGGEIVGALPYAVCDHPGLGRIVNSLPWWGSHGGVALDRTAHAASDIRTTLLGAFAERVEQLNPLSAVIILPPAEEAFRDAYLALPGFAAIDSRTGQMTPLPPTGPAFEADLIASFSQKTRNLVRKALKQGFDERVADDDPAWDFLVSTHEANINTLGGRAKPRAHFDALRMTIPPSMRRLSLAMDGETPVAALLCVTFNGTVEYLTPVVRVEHRARQPLSMLIWRGMEAAALAGARAWNWGGTWHTQTSLRHFKAGFGAREMPYSYVVKASQQARALFAARKSELGTLFPYFYTYPYDQLGA